MARKLWGEFTSVENIDSEEQMITVCAKQRLLDEVEGKVPVTPDKNVTVKVKNPFVTQTIEVMKQTEMLKSLIDTYSNKSGSSNYLLNPCQMIPEVDFPVENATDFVSDDKFTKPFWFVSPRNTKFLRGERQKYPAINAEIRRASLRKALCGQLRVSGFTDSAESALILFSDAIDQFVQNFINKAKEVEVCNKSTQPNLEITTLEKAYYSLTNSSITDVHNYLKHNVIARNRQEISEFKDVFQEYDKLMKESRNVQKEDLQEGDFLNILEMSSNEASTNQVTIMDTDRTSNLPIMEDQLHKETGSICQEQQSDQLLM